MSDRQATGDPCNVLFLCTGNSARSIFGEAILNRIGKGKFVAHSAGSHPAGEVNPHALALLNRLDFPTEGLRSKSWNEFAKPGAPVLDFVITVCDNVALEVCPVWPGQPMTIHWSVPNPTKVAGNETTIAREFSDVFALMQRKIEFFADPASSPAAPERSVDYSSRAESRRSYRRR